MIHLFDQKFSKNWTVVKKLLQFKITIFWMIHWSNDSENAALHHRNKHFKIQNNYSDL